MNIIRKNIFLYTAIIIIPTILAVLLFKQYLENQEKLELQQDTLKLGELQQQYIQTLIKETVKSLDVLSIVSLDFVNKKEDMKSLLLKTKKTDKRYGDLYLVNAKGVVVTGTKDDYNGIEVRDSYIKSCAKLKQAQVTVVKEDGYKKLITVCNPVLDENNAISSFLLVQLKLEYIQSVLELLTPQIAVKITDQFDNKIFTINDDLKVGDYQQSMPFEDLPWKLHINHPQQEINIDSNTILQFTIVFLIVTHIIFFVIQFMLLQRDAIRQKKIHESQKLKMLGTLAATTAHEIKNPLTGIKGLVQLLSEKYQNNQDQMYFSVIQQEITRINEIVNEFLVLGKPSAHPLEIVDLKAVVAEIQPILQVESNNHSTILYVNNTEEDLFVCCLKDQIKQVILNITKNSFEASSPGDQVAISVAKEQANAILTIEDNGKGMSKSTLKKIFEPFYTTKNYGTGLGLYVCKRIITNFNGTITINSKRHIGTTITIVLPIVDSKK
ncbi:PAS domain-containing sensor histidine kinase [Bacillus massiliigorillae]|uniref:PAS domain-containing sensor histidine kinase n=1 Tax=Bacillus massiliigorillae TaxID=1243664 RepID=UPI0003A949E5|nr:PAS domain-containing sensor histidine kinase [Bacillus massiliigorillae]